MRIAIWGLGSIGNRHWDNFEKVGFDVCGVSAHNKTKSPVFSNIQECLVSGIDAVFICNETSKHYDSLLELKKFGFSGGVIVEKPIFSDLENIDVSSFKFCIVSYQLRLNSLVQALKIMIADQKLLTAIFYVGQYLPHWRPTRDYREVYSAHKNQGGGVLRDLSHEIDLAFCLAGKINKIVAVGGKASNLEIDVEDHFSLLGSSDKCEHVSIHMNYLDKSAQRFIIINTEEHTYKLDFIQKVLLIDGKEAELGINLIDPYIALADRVQSGNIGDLTSFEEGLDIIKIIKACEKSSKELVWEKI